MRPLELTKLAAIEQLYTLWASGELASEDILFELGDILASEEAEPVQSRSRAGDAALDAIGPAH